MEFPNQTAILQAYSRVKPYVHRTPILTNSYINQLTNA